MFNSLLHQRNTRCLCAKNLCNNKSTRSDICHNNKYYQEEPFNELSYSYQKSNEGYFSNWRNAFTNMPCKDFANKSALRYQHDWVDLYKSLPGTHNVEDRNWNKKYYSFGKQQTYETKKEATVDQKEFKPVFNAFLNCFQKARKNILSDSQMYKNCCRKQKRLVISNISNPYTYKEPEVKIESEITQTPPVAIKHFTVPTRIKQVSPNNVEYEELMRVLKEKNSNKKVRKRQSFRRLAKTSNENNILSAEEEDTTFEITSLSSINKVPSIQKKIKKARKRQGLRNLSKTTTEPISRKVSLDNVKDLISSSTHHSKQQRKKKGHKRKDLRSPSQSSTYISLLSVEVDTKSFHSTSENAPTLLNKQIKDSGHGEKLVGTQATLNTFQSSRSNKGSASKLLENFNQSRFSQSKGTYVPTKSKQQLKAQLSSSSVTSKKRAITMVPPTSASNEDRIYFYIPEDSNEKQLENSRIPEEDEGEEDKAKDDFDEIFDTKYRHTDSLTKPKEIDLKEKKNKIKKKLKKNIKNAIKKEKDEKKEQHCHICDLFNRKKSEEDPPYIKDMIKQRQKQELKYYYCSLAKNGMPPPSLISNENENTETSKFDTRKILLHCYNVLHQFNLIVDQKIYRKEDFWKAKT